MQDWIRGFFLQKNLKLWTKHNILLEVVPLKQNSRYSKSGKVPRKWGIRFFAAYPNSDTFFWSHENITIMSEDIIKLIKNFKRCLSTHILIQIFWLFRWKKTVGGLKILCYGKLLFPKYIEKMNFKCNSVDYYMSHD